MNNNPGRAVSVFQISEIFEEAYSNCQHYKRIRKIRNIFHLSDVFTDVHYAAASTIEQEEDNEFLASRPSPRAVPDTIQVLSTPTRNLPSLISIRASPAVCEEAVMPPPCAILSPEVVEERPTRNTHIEMISCCLHQSLASHQHILIKIVALCHLLHQHHLP
ncbi:hypothetical protein JTB14_002098 [Gonioctena quinquepunctata]|nr:hypothetical protein JTB14_002098 [Gonioctena quinquepunctata]